MRPSQNKIGAPMVEVRKIAPRLDRVTGFTTELPASCIAHLHASGEFTLVRVAVAGGAAQIVEVKYGCARSRRRFVAIDASHGHVSASQRESCLLMTRQVEGCAVKGGLVVASLTTVEVRGSSKLAVMDVLMTVEALRCLDPEYRGTSCRYMTFFTGNIRVFCAQWEAGLAVVGNRELCRLEAVDRMARIASAAVRTSKELSVVGVWLMAIGAGGVRYGRLEVSIVMARLAGDIKMFTFERVFRFAVIKLCDKCAALPRCGGVTGLAPLLKLTAVRIVMAG